MNAGSWLFDFPHWAETRRAYMRNWNPEQMLHDLRSWGWSSDMLAEVETRTREAMAADPSLPIGEHMFDAVFAVRYPAK